MYRANRVFTLRREPFAGETNSFPVIDLRRVGTAGFEPTTSCTPNGPKTSKNQRKTPGIQRILEKPAGFSMLFKT
jgi:hypothetical protein